MTTDKIPADRRILRLPVRFWAQGRSSDSHVGYTTNVSASGMFIATRSPLPPSTIIEITIVRQDEVQVIRGEVVRAVIVMPLTETAQPSGMGIRFVRPDDPSVRTLVGTWHQFVTRQFQSSASR